ncbi:MAG: alpha/beta hydrolase [Pantoea sp.]|nr:alpha/beta hydrolase [Pantoea sp.]
MKRTPRRRRPDNRAVLLGMATAIAGTALLVRKWRKWQQTPPVGIHSHQAGLAGYYQQVGPWRMFTRTTPETRPGLPVVLLHGLALSGRAMEDLALALGWEYRVLVPDLPGFGGSAFPASQPVLDVDRLAEALWMWMQQNQHRRSRSLLHQVWRDWRNGRRESHRSAAALCRVDFAKAGVWRMVGTLRAMLRDRIEQRLPHIKAPVLVVRGSYDVVSPARWVEEMVALLPRGELITLPKGTHTLHYVYPWSYSRAIRPFIARVQKEYEHHE